MESLSPFISLLQERLCQIAGVNGQYTDIKTNRWGNIVGEVKVEGGALGKVDNRKSGSMEC